MRTHIFNSVIYKYFGELDRRFSNSNMTLSKAIGAFIPDSINFLNMETLAKLAMQYTSKRVDINLKVEQIRSMIE